MQPDGIELVYEDGKGGGKSHYHLYEVLRSH